VRATALRIAAQRPIAVTPQASSAKTMNTRGTMTRKGRPSACDSRYVPVVYIPSGNTMAQSCGV
jgi:hypothetical protein